MPRLTVGQRVWIASGIHHGRRGVIQWTHQAHLAIIVGVAVQALAFGSLRVGEHTGGGQQEATAQEVKFTAVSGHFLLLLHLEVGFVTRKAQGHRQ